MPERFQAANVLSAAEGTAVIVSEGYASVGVQVTVSGDWNGTLTFEASIDGGTWTALSLTPAGGGAAVTSTVAAGLWRGAIGGFKGIRARVSAYVAGSATVQLAVAR